MKIGILSDTHGNMPRTVRAAELLKIQGVEAVIHCGDICAQGVIDELAAAFDPPRTPVFAVLGNCDYDDLAGSGVELCGRFADIELGSKRIAIIHGDDYPLFSRTVACQEFDYIFTGHTHAREDRMAGRTRIINPGAVHRASEPGVAVLDTKTGALVYLDL